MIFINREDCHDALSAYKQIYDEEIETNQANYPETFLERVTPPQEELKVGPSGGSFSRHFYPR